MAVKENYMTPIPNKPMGFIHEKLTTEARSEGKEFSLFGNGKGNGQLTSNSNCFIPINKQASYPQNSVLKKVVQRDLFGAKTLSSNGCESPYASD